MRYNFDKYQNKPYYIYAIEIMKLHYDLFD